MKASKKRYKTSRTAPAGRSWGLLIAVAAAFLLIGGGLLLWGQSGRKPGLPAPVNGAPRAAIAQESVDHGDVKFETPVSTVFQISNTGDKPLQILGEPQVELVEGC